MGKCVAKQKHQHSLCTNSPVSRIYMHTYLYKRIQELRSQKSELNWNEKGSLVTCMLIAYDTLEFVCRLKNIFNGFE